MRLFSLKTLGYGVLAMALLAVVLVTANWPKREFKDGVQYISFDVSSLTKDCGSSFGKVAGLRSKMTFFEWVIVRLEQIYRQYVDHWQSDTVRVIYKLSRGTIENIQDISFETTEAFHKNATYELACTSRLNGEAIVFRKMGPQYKNPSHTEPTLNLLPKDCLGQEGEVIVKLAEDGDKSPLLSELMSGIFRATIWDKDEGKTLGSSLDLYMPRMGYALGERMTFHAHGLDADTPASIELIRVGNGKNTWKKIEGIKLAPQKITPYAYRDGLNWPATFELEVPEDAPLGYQVAVLRQGDKTATYPFVISPKSAKANTIAVIASTNTWQSYNNWGEASHYESQIGEGCLNTDYARIISTQRPVGFADLLAETPFGDHLFMAEKRLAEWLDKNKMTYAVYTDDDLHENPKLLEEYKTVMLTPHPEYFTKEMFDSLEKHVKKGGNIINLGGNALYYRVTRQGNQIEKHENGRLHDLDKQFGGTWAGYLGRSPASLLGVEFDARDYGTFAPMTVVNAQHPLFKGTGLKNGETFAPNGSGHEMDRLSSWSPASTVLLAEGANPKGFGAHMVLVEHPSGGKVFSSGSISFYYALANDERLGTLVKNVIKMMEAE